jgi:hypothetical protein
MNDTEKFNLEYTGVYVQAANCVVVHSEAEDLAEKQIDHTYSYLYFNGKCLNLKQWPNAIVGTAHLGNDPIQLFFLTANGKVYKRVKGVVTEEILDTSDEGPSDLLLMRNLIAVGEQLIAVGMARRAYRRSSAGSWSAIDASCFVRRQDRKSATGFNTVVAVGGELVAAGYKGEIWRYDGASWSAESSPTNVNLTCAAAARGEVIIAGLAGLIVRGTPGSWSVFSQTITSANFWSAVEFNDDIYLSNDEGVFKLSRDRFEPVQLDASRKPTTMYLSAKKEAIWSVGQKDIYSSADGKTWVREENP